MTHIDYDTFNNKQQFNISRKMIHGYDIMICHMIYSSSIERGEFTYIYICIYKCLCTS